MPPEQYDSVAAQLRDSQAEVTRLENDIKRLEEQSKAAGAQLKASQAEVARLQGQVSGLKEQYELVGKTPAETAGKIVEYYHKTHIYSEYDYYVCSDMASDVWNMLKTQGIPAKIAVGDIDTPVSDIIQPDHAWVLAEVSPGNYLALETTGGFTVPRSTNPLYYRGWSFASPADLKSHNQLISEYNTRVGIMNQIVAQDREVVAKHNQATDPTTADKLRAVHDKLVEIMKQQENELNNTLAEINKLATPL